MGFVPISRPRYRSGGRARFGRAAQSALVAAALLGLPGASAFANTAEFDRVASHSLSGWVVDSSAPVVEARVFAYQLVERTLDKVLTDGAGRFLFESLPAGIYKIIAHKPGFEPAVMLLQRQASDAPQSVTLSLAREAAAESDYWTMRSEIPRDVLREIGYVAAGSPVEEADLATGMRADDSGLRAEVAAVSGVDELKPKADVKVSGGNVGIAGRLGEVKVFLAGDFQNYELEPGGSSGAMAVDGSTQSVSLSLDTPNQGVFDLQTESNQLHTSENGLMLPIEASHYRFGWNRGVGDHGETSVQGYYLEELNLYNQGWINPVQLPFASRTFELEGNYSHQLDFGKLRGGLRYRERSGSYSRRFAPGQEFAVEYLDAFGDGDWRLNETVLLEYGLFTTLRDGTVSLTPRGGVVVELGGAWQGSVAAAHRVSVDDLAAWQDDFLPLFVEGTLDCSQSEIACYELGVQRGSGEGDHFGFGGSYRELDSTLRLFFSTNFLDHSEGLFLVPGDELPEFHATFRKRLSPNVVTQVSSSFAEGGGGVYRAVNNRLFENNVELVSTVVDTRFESTATGVFVAFHRLEQVLEPMSPRFRTESAGLERLELVLNQDLSRLLDLSADWAVQIGMELARGASFFHSDVDPEALRRQIMTGVAVRF